MKITKEHLQKIIQEALLILLKEEHLDEGVLDRLSAQAGSTVAGLKGAAKSGLVGARGAVGQFATGIAQKGLKAIGANKAAAELAANREAEADAVKRKQGNIAAATEANREAVVVDRLITPRIAEIENDLKKVSKNPEIIKKLPKIQQALQILRSYVQELKQDAASQGTMRQNKLSAANAALAQAEKSGDAKNIQKYTQIIKNLTGSVPPNIKNVQRIPGKKPAAAPSVGGSSGAPIGVPR